MKKKKKKIDLDGEGKGKLGHRGHRDASGNLLNFRLKRKVTPKQCTLTLFVTMAIANQTMSYCGH